MAVIKKWFTPNFALVNRFPSLRPDFFVSSFPRKRESRLSRRLDPRLRGGDDSNAKFGFTLTLRNSKLATRNSQLPKGQALTEMVLLVPLFLIVAIGIVKIFALAVLVQKMELASYYAGRRWMLESHKNSIYSGWDKNTLGKDIESKIALFLGAGDRAKEQFLGFQRNNIKFKIEPTLVYGVLTLKVAARGVIPFRPDLEKRWEIIKYAPTRDRPIQWDVPAVGTE